MSKYPITQAQWNAVWSSNQPYWLGDKCNSNPSYFKGDNLPVHGITWHDASIFCKQLSLYTGKNYRLPYATLWEYACRAGTNTPFYFGETLTRKLANYSYTNEKQVTPVGIFPPNLFGLYDLHGNVWEWCTSNWHVLDDSDFFLSKDELKGLINEYGAENALNLFAKRDVRNLAI